MGLLLFFFLGGGANGGPGLEDGIAMIFFPITFIVHNLKSIVGGGGGNGGGGVCEWGDMAPPGTHSYATGCAI